MKAFLKVSLISLTLAILVAQCEKKQKVNNEPINIPDKAFLSALIEQGVDTNGDSIISYGEAEKINILNVRRQGIHDIKGIEAFINLDTLDCSDNQISNMDISNNNALVFLDCNLNNLASLDISNNTLLSWLDCEANRILNIDVSKITTLTFLEVGHNDLTILNLANNTSLLHLACDDNKLTDLNLSNNNSLVFLACDRNDLLTLDISNTTQLQSLIIYDNPNLGEVCVWTMPFPPEGVGVEKEGSPNVYFTTDCSQ